MRNVILIAHNLRSAHNVGSLLRTAEGLGVKKVCLTGYSPYPRAEQDERLPHIAEKMDKQITKTALGAERMVPWEHFADISLLIPQLQREKFVVAALEQAATAIPLPDYDPPQKIAIVVGREVEGIEPVVLAACDVILEIPMVGKKESFNVAVAAAMALYEICFTS